MKISKADLEDDSGFMWDELCDLAGLPPTDNDQHPWNHRAFAQLEITQVKLSKLGRG